MRTLTGQLVLPDNAPVTRAAYALIQVRDISLADAPSQLVAEQRLSNVDLKPRGRIGFNIHVPEVEANRMLSLWAHISLDGAAQIKSGDLLTTAISRVPSQGVSVLPEVPVAVI